MWGCNRIYWQLKKFNQIAVQVLFSLQYAETLFANIV